MIPYITFGSIQIATFFLVISISLSILLVLLSKRVEHFSRSRKISFDIAIILMIAGFVGARLMHVFYEERTFYEQNPIQILYFWQGGFVFFGGLIGCCIAGGVYTAIKKIDFLMWADFFTPLFSLAHALGRIGCFLSGCCFGRSCDLPWSVDGRHPTALYLFFSELLTFALLLFIEKKRYFKRVGNLFFSWLLIQSLIRFFIEYIRDDFRGLFFNIPAFGSISISQFLSLIIVVVSMVFFATETTNNNTKK